MKGTLASARQALEDALPGLSDYQANEARKALTALEDEARSRADTYCAEREAEVKAMRDRALRDLTATRDEMESLTAEGSTGRLSAAEYAERLNSLVARQFQSEEVLSRAEALVERIEAIEGDPLAWADDLATRTRMRPDVPW